MPSAKSGILFPPDPKPGKASGSPPSFLLLFHLLTAIPVYKNSPRHCRRGQKTDQQDHPQPEISDINIGPFLDIINISGGITQCDPYIVPSLFPSFFTDKYRFVSVSSSNLSRKKSEGIIVHSEIMDAVTCVLVDSSSAFMPLSMTSTSVPAFAVYRFR